MIRIGGYHDSAVILRMGDTSSANVFCLFRHIYLRHCLSSPCQPQSLSTKLVLRTSSSPLLVSGDSPPNIHHTRLCNYTRAAVRYQSPRCRRRVCGCGKHVVGGFARRHPSADDRIWLHVWVGIGNILLCLGEAKDGRDRRSDGRCER